MPLYKNRSAQTSLMKKCDLKLDLLEILYGFHIYLVCQLRGFHMWWEYLPHRLAAPRKARGCTDGVTPPRIPHLPSLPAQAPSKTETILTAADLPETENTRHLVPFHQLSCNTIILHFDYHTIKNPLSSLNEGGSGKLGLERAGQRWESKHPAKHVQSWTLRLGDL